MKKVTAAAEGGPVELTREEKEVIDQRLDAYHRNPEASALWGEVLKRFMNSHEI